MFIFPLPKWNIRIWFFYWMWGLTFLFLMHFIFYLKDVGCSLTNENYRKCIKGLVYSLIVLKYSIFFTTLLNYMLSPQQMHLFLMHISLILYSKFSPCYFEFSCLFFADFLKLVKDAGNMEMRSGRGMLRSPATQRDIK
jgi:hypothetical protein